MCMMRADYPELFPEYSRILSLDIDVVINDNVSDLWDYDLTDYYLAGVPERQRQKSSADPLYINFGVVMMNLDKLRHDRKRDEIVNDFTAMLEAYSAQEINERTVSATAAKYETPKLLSGAFIKTVLKTAGPLCAVGFMVCLVLIIRSRRKEEKALLIQN